MVAERIVWEWIRDVENLVENLEITQKTGECLPTQEILALKVLVRQIARDMRKTLQENDNSVTDKPFVGSWIETCSQYANELCTLEAKYRNGGLRDYEFALGVIEIANALEQTGYPEPKSA
jgi:hypothetical protein